MKISRNAYIDKRVYKPEIIIRNLESNKKVDNIYCIIYTPGGFLEIIRSSKINNSNNDSILIGMANTKKQAIELLVYIFEKVYIPNPDIKEMIRYFTVNQ